MIVFMYLFYDYNALSINTTEIIGIDLQLNSSNGTLLASGELEMVSNEEFVVLNRDRNR